MIAGEHGVIRSAGIDDIGAFQRLYESAEPVSALLDTKRELVAPTRDELRELFGGAQSEQVRGLNTIEDGEGCIRGFCSLRPNPLDPLFGQLLLMFFEPEMYGRPLAREVCEHLLNEGFRRRLMHKVLAQCMGHEAGLRSLLVELGFTSDGIQREVFYSRGRWYDLESFTLMNPNRDRRLAAGDGAGFDFGRATRGMN